MASGDVIYFLLPLQMESLFINAQPSDSASYVNQWKSIGDDQGINQVLQNLPTADVNAIKNKLSAAKFMLIAERQIPGSDETSVFMEAKTSSGLQFLLEVRFKAGMNVIKATVKSSNKELSTGVKDAVSRLIS